MAQSDLRQHTPNLTVEVYPLEVAEGTLLVVRVPKGPAPPYGTPKGLYKVRVGKNCMPYPPDQFIRTQVSLGALDWSRELVNLNLKADLDPAEIVRVRNVIAARRPSSDLVRLDEMRLLEALGLTRQNRLTRAGLLLVGRTEVLEQIIPNHEVIYLHRDAAGEPDMRMDLKAPLLKVLESVTDAINARNAFRTLKTGLFHVDIPDFPEEAIREGLLNALIHRDYLEPGSVLVRHSERAVTISSPGGFIGGITPENILHAEPKARNRLLAEVFQKLGLVQRPGLGRERIFRSTLAYGKRPPLYETDGHTVRLTIYDGSFDERLAAFVAKRRRSGQTFDLIELLLLSHLRNRTEIDIATAARLCQLPEARAREQLDRICVAPNAWLEKRGRTKGVTYHLARWAASELLGKAISGRLRGIDRIRWPELIRQFVEQHESISNSECRALLNLGNSRSAVSQVSRLLGKLDFLEPFGSSKRNRRYRLSR